MFIRFRYLKADDFEPDTSKQKNAIDLRPAIIAKLQQLVKDASNGLYVLSVEKAEPHLLSSKLDLFNTSIRIDTTVMLRMDSLQLLPDNIFTFHFSTLHIDGIGIDDLFHKDRIEMTGIRITNPVIDIYYRKRLYNEANRRRNDTLTLYEKLKGQMKKIEVGQINIVNGTFINHDLLKHRSRKFIDVSIAVNNLLIDSTTQYDKTRFLFAKHVALNTKNYSVPTLDGLYFFTAGNISITGEDHTITALNVQLKPRYNRQEFAKKLRYGKDMYNLVLPKVILRDVKWEALINNEEFVSKYAEIHGGSFSIFFDRALPKPPIELNNFPHQVLMRIPFPFSIMKCNVRNLDLSYEEHNPLTDKNGIVYFDNINAEIDNATNIPAEIRKQRYSTLSARASFMHHVPLAVKFRYDLSKYRTGEFIADVQMDALDNVTINPVAERLGLFSVKTGQMQKAVIHVQGNNFNTNGNITMHYNDLHITPLKKDDDGDLKKKRITGLLANIILIKNENPKGSELRQPDFTVERGTHKNFFNLLWASILTGVVKTVGIPTKFVRK